MSVTHFRDLDVWQVSMSLAKAIYRLTAEFPSAERYGLTSQLQRAAVSVPSNIAEGNARTSRKDYLRFLSMASGSVAEVQTQVLLANELGLVTRAAAAESLRLAERVSQMLHRTQKSLRRGLADTGPRVPGPGSRVSESRISEATEEYH